MLLRLVPVLFLLLAAAAPLWCAKSPINETDLLKIQKVSDIDIAADGSLVVFGVLSIHTEPAASPGGEPSYEYRTNLWMRDLRNASAEPLELTAGDRKDTMPSISPDGSTLAFIRADAKKHGQVWLMPLRTAGEPHMITKFEFGAAALRWRKDGKALLVTSAVPLSKLPGTPTFDLERPGRQWDDVDHPEAGHGEGSTAKPDAKMAGSPDGDLRAVRDWLERNAERNNPSDLTRMAFLGELSLAGEMTFSELFRVDLSPDSDGEARITQLTSTYRDHTGAGFSPDGEAITFISTPASRLHPDRIRDQAAVWQVNPNGSNERPLLEKQGYSFRSAQFTPDGKNLVVTGAQNDQPTYRQTMVGIASNDGSGLKWLTRDGDAGISAIDVSEPGFAYCTRNFQGGEPLEKIDLQSGKTEEITSGPVGVNAFAAAAGKLVYAQISVADPNELYLQTAAEKAVAVTKLNSGWLESKMISMPEEHWLKRPNGQKVQYWVMKPMGAEAGKRYPWVLDMHGGPSAMWGPGEISMWHEFQIFCSFGYGVVYANPRGSSGYGYAFQHANYKDWGDGPMSDVMAVMDETAATYPLVDKDQLFLTGGSYAGYLTAWMVGHTDRFKAAAALRGVYDLSTFFGEGNAYRLVPEEFGGFPWEPETRRLLDKESPISYVANIKTPLLLIHGSSDNRTGVVQGQMLFRALKQMNRPVEYIRYPGAGHELTRSGAPLQRMDHMLRILEFFARYTKDPHPAGPNTPTSTAATSVR